MYLLENNLTPELVNFLHENKIIGENEKVISIEKPGEGNMNFVLRIITDQRSFIIKQSRDFVQKYPQIPAPIDRLLIEAKFYETISKSPFLSSQMPKLLAVLPNHYVLAMEDLGENIDYSYIYKKDSDFSETEVIELAKYLNQLHSIDIQQYPSNMELKKLNHFHIFDFPFQLENGFDLDQTQNGLQEISLKYKNENQLKSNVKKLGEIYLGKGKTLIHGDFYPGSWLKTEQGIKVIDPEFGYLGRPEFDLGVFIAHLAIAGKTQYISTLNANYIKNTDFDNQLMCGFAGVEILRRLLGVAQLPIELSLDQKKQLLSDANSLLFTGKAAPSINLKEFKNKKL